MNALGAAGAFALGFAAATVAGVSAFVVALGAESRARQRNRDVTRRVEW